MRHVRPRRALVAYLAVFAASVLLTSWIASLLVAADNGQRAADRAASQASAQASIVADQRAAQTRRIDSLSHQLATTRAQVSAQARVIGRQEQAIRDLAAQVGQMGGRPVASRVSADRTTPRTPAPTRAPTSSATSKPRASSKPHATPNPTPQPAPSPTTTQPHDDGPLGLCVLLAVPGLC